MKFYQINNEDPFERYINLIYRNERKQARQNMLTFTLIGIITISIIAGARNFRQSSHPGFRTVPSDLLNIFMVDSLLRDSPAPIVIAYGGGITDTIFSIEEYLDLQPFPMGDAEYTKFRDSIEDRTFLLIKNNLRHSVFQNQEGIKKTGPEHLKNRAGDSDFQVFGDFRPGGEVLFSLQNYNPALIYTLDLGDGSRQLIRNQRFYNYSDEGKYRVRLFVSDGITRMIVSEKYLHIQDPRHQDEVVAENFNSIHIEGNTRGSDETESAPSSQEIIAVADYPERKVRTKPSSYAEIMPSFPGGERALYHYLANSLTYPPDALARKVKGKVYIRFVVNEDGSLSDFQVVRGIGNGCDAEALRVVSAMPAWVPGREGGKNIPVYNTIAISFTTG